MRRGWARQESWSSGLVGRRDVQFLVSVRDVRLGEVHTRQLPHRAPHGRECCSTRARDQTRTTPLMTHTAAQIALAAPPSAPMTHLEGSTTSSPLSLFSRVTRPAYTQHLGSECSATYTHTRNPPSSATLSSLWLKSKVTLSSLPSCCRHHIRPERDTQTRRRRRRRERGDLFHEHTCKVLARHRVDVLERPIHTRVSVQTDLSLCVHVHVCVRERDQTCPGCPYGCSSIRPVLSCTARPYIGISESLIWLNLQHTHRVRRQPVVGRKHIHSRSLQSSDSPGGKSQIDRSRGGTAQRSECSALQCNRRAQRRSRARNATSRARKWPSKLPRPQTYLAVHLSSWRSPVLAVLHHPHALTPPRQQQRHHAARQTSADDCHLRHPGK